MPLKLSVGLSKKVGEWNYGSRGACVNFEVELDAGSLQQPDRLQEQIRRLYSLARVSVTEELQLQAAVAPAAPNDTAPKGNGDNGLGGEGKDLLNPIVRPATEGQVKAIYSLAKRKQLDLAALMRSRFSVDRVEDLSLPAASSLIDELKHDEAKTSA